MVERRKRGSVGRNADNRRHEEPPSRTDEKRVVFQEALFYGIATIEFAIGGAFLSYQHTLQGIGLMVSGTVFVLYALFVHFRHKIKGIRKPSYTWLIVAVILNTAGFSPLLLLPAYANKVPSYYLTLNTVLRTGKVLRSVDAADMYGIATDVPAFVMPIQAAISFTVDNVSQSQQQIKAVSVFSSTHRNGPWMALCPVSSEGLTLVLSVNRKDSVLVDTSNFVNGNLLGKDLVPGDAITSWVALECTKSCPGSYYKIVVRDAAGRSGTIISGEAFGEGEVMLAPKSGFRTLGPGPDLTPMSSRIDPACR